MVPDDVAGRREELLLRTLRRRRSVRAERVQLRRRRRRLRETEAGARDPPGPERRRLATVSRLQPVRFVVVVEGCGPPAAAVRRGMVAGGPTK